MGTIKCKSRTKPAELVIFTNFILKLPNSVSTWNVQESVLLNFLPLESNTLILISILLSSEVHRLKAHFRAAP